MKRIPTQHSLIIILTFLLAYYGRKILNNFIEIPFTTTEAKILYVYAWWLIPVIVCLGLLYGWRHILEELRIHKGFVLGFGLSVVITLPMLLSSAFMGELNKDLTLTMFLQKTFIAGFTEEVLFRGFLFGILFRRLNWGFIPAAVLGAVIFGLGHLYQGNSIGETIGVFAVTFMGAVWFAWLFIEWNENLWVPIFLHILMNLSWVLFDISDNALGGQFANLFRIITITLSIVLTIIYNKQKGRFAINRGNLFSSKSSLDSK